MNTDTIRQDQLSEGRMRGTLGVKAGYERPPRRPSAPGHATRKPFVAKGHDAILKEIMDTGAVITVTMMSDGTKLEGKLVARDKFTLSVRQSDGATKVIYKHAIESFEYVQVQ